MADYTNNMNFLANLLPYETNSGKIGNPTNIWSSIYSNNINVKDTTITNFYAEFNPGHIDFLIPNANVNNNMRFHIGSTYSSDYPSINIYEGDVNSSGGIDNYKEYIKISSNEHGGFLTLHTLDNTYWKDGKQVNQYWYAYVHQNNGSLTLHTQADEGSATVNSTGRYIYFQRNGSINIPTVHGGSWIKASHEGSINITSATNASANNFGQSFLTMKTKSGSWSIGSLSQTDKLYFVWGSDANYVANTNTTEGFSIETDGKSNIKPDWSNIQNKPSTFSPSSHTHSYLPLTGGTLTGQLYLNYEQDVGLNQNGSLIIGNKAGENIGIDSNEIMARNNSAASILYLNSEGGRVFIGSGGLSIGSSTASYGNIMPNTGTYGMLKLTGTKGGYAGLQIGDNKDTQMTIMDNGGDKGLYQTSSGTWILYYNKGNNNVGIRTSSTASYNVNINGTMNVSSTITQNGTAVSLSGHTHTYLIAKSNVDRATKPASWQGMNAIRLNDKDDNAITLLQTAQASNDNLQRHMGMYVYNSSGSNGSLGLLWNTSGFSWWCPTICTTAVNFNNSSGITAVKFNGNASTATKLATARTISLTGAVTGSGSFDGSGNLSISTSQNHHHADIRNAQNSTTGNPTRALYISDSTGNILPRIATSYSGPFSANDAAQSLGNPGYRWKTVYASSATISTSDKKLKNHIEYLSEDDKLDNFFMNLKGVLYTSMEGDSGRRHMGFYAQDVAENAKNTIGDLSMYEASQLLKDGEEEPGYFDENLTDDELRWGLKYEELIAPTITMVQKNVNRIEELEKRDEYIKSLEDRIVELERRLNNE